MSNHSFQSDQSSSDGSSRVRILRILADGHYHSGTALGQQLDISRTAVWKQIQALIAAGLEIYSVQGRGYQLQNPPELLEKDRIFSALKAHAKSVLQQFDVEFTLASTNDCLLDRLNKESVHGHVILAESQSQGRGRRGRNWHSPPAAGIYLSIGWHYTEIPKDISCLSLAAGVAVVRALKTCGVSGAGLKWPNDIYYQQQKLGGLLLESRTEHGGDCDIVLGLGINVNLPEKADDEIEQPWTDLAACCSSLPSRNTLATEIINELVSSLDNYAETGFKNVRQEWRQLDCASGRNARLLTSDGEVMGRVIGIDDQGLLEMAVNGYVQKYMSGEISFKVEN